MAFNITLNYSLMSVPCKYEKATVTEEAMKNLCVGQPGKPQHDATPLTQPKTCATCGPVTDFTVIKKGVKQGSSYAILEQTEVAEVKQQNVDVYKNKLDIVQVPSKDLLANTGPGKSVNYVTPAAGGEGHYALLAKLIEEHPERSFVGLFTPRSRIGLYRLTTRDGVIVMEERTREQNMKPVPEVDDEINQPMFDLLEATMDKLDTAYDPDAFEDKYAVALAELVIEAQDSVTIGKSESKTTSKATVPASDADLMAKLKALAES